MALHGVLSKELLEAAVKSRTNATEPQRRKSICVLFGFWMQDVEQVWMQDVEQDVEQDPRGCTRGCLRVKREREKGAVAGGMVNRGMPAA